MCGPVGKTDEESSMSMSIMCVCVCVCAEGAFYVSVRGVCVVATVGVQAGSRASLSSYPNICKQGTRYYASRSTPALTRVERLVGVRLV